MSEEKKSKKGCLMTILIVVAIVVLIGVGGGYYVYNNFKSLAVSAIFIPVKQIVSSYPIAEDTKTKLNQQIDRVKDGIIAGKLDESSVSTFLENVDIENTMKALAVEVFIQSYLEKSGLSVDEKQQLKANLNRFLHALYHKDFIKGPNSDKFFEDLKLEEQSDGTMKFPESMTDDELRQVSANAKIVADEYNIAENLPKFDVMANFTKAVDAMLK